MLKPPKSLSVAHAIIIASIAPCSLAYAQAPGAPSLPQPIECRIEQGVGRTCVYVSKCITEECPQRMKDYVSAEAGRIIRQAVKARSPQ